MKTFDEIYDELKSNDNKELNETWESAKKATEKAKMITLIICSIIDILFVIIFLPNIMQGGTMIFLPQVLIFALIMNLFVYAITNAICGGKKQIEYNKKYKKIVINKLMNNFYDNLEYFPEKEMPEYIYKQLNYEIYDIYKSEDYFEAQLNNNSIQMAEILTQKIERYKDSDGNTKTRTVTKFSGLFAKIMLEKSVENELKILPNGAMLFQKNKQLKMDSSEFEKYFDVQASNKILGMQLLTADVMEELVEFINKTNIRYEVNIKNNEIYLRFHCGAMFEPQNIKSGAIDKESLRKYFYMLNFTYNLSNKLIKTINDTEI